MLVSEIIKCKLPEIISLREKLSLNAELSFKEFKTQKILLDFLNKSGLKTSVLYNTGVSALLNNGEECIALRADMDALPVNGVSHVCGHDYHMAIIIGTALVLKELGYENCVKFIFQPAEEDEGGALPMIKEGVLENPKVTEIIGLHVWPGLKVGKISVGPGSSMASVDDFHITFKGIGGHAAMPEAFINPIYPAIEFIENIKTHNEDSLVSVACINSGNTSNVVSSEAIVKGTVRTFNVKLRENLKEKIINSANTVAKNHGCEAEIYYSWQYPPLINDKKLTEEFIQSSKIILGNENVLPLVRTFAAEDFSFFAEKVPALHFRLGIADDNKGLAPLHSTFFNVNDDAVFYGIYVIVNFLINKRISIKQDN
ncbi:MAG: amidohydrolase [Clostridiaceae bacterium]|nr:amidohydrolase [Clostridiaceae bacterium]